MVLRLCQIGSRYFSQAYSFGLCSRSYKLQRLKTERSVDIIDDWVECSLCPVLDHVFRAYYYAWGVVCLDAVLLCIAILYIACMHTGDS